MRPCRDDAERDKLRLTMYATAGPGMSSSTTHAVANVAMVCGVGIAPA